MQGWKFRKVIRCLVCAALLVFPISLSVLCPDLSFAVQNETRHEADLHCASALPSGQQGQETDRSEGRCLIHCALLSSIPSSPGGNVDRVSADSFAIDLPLPSQLLLSNSSHLPILSHYECEPKTIPIYLSSCSFLL
ncbi:MAG: hypothetical protein HY391_00390 [Deltaproteobacteria bacterium]|nr:hypothetical protein [Deltaproteobacteria bacterium]